PMSQGRGWGDGVDIPSAEPMGQAAGIQSASARWESLLDRQFLSQSTPHPAHARLPRLMEGASLPCDYTHTRLLSPVAYRALKDLFAAQDPTLEAIFVTYRDAGGAAQPGAYEDFLQSLLTLSQRWKRTLFLEQDPHGFLRQSRALF